jgi:uncharacterized membrane protein YdcZ (DUF606 family)
MSNKRLFTLLYLAVAVLLTVIALQSKITSNLASEVWIFAGLSYFVAFISMFSFWRQGIFDRERRMALQPAWQQTSLTLIAGILLAIIIFSPLLKVPTTGWSVELFVQMCSRLPLVVLSAEQLVVRCQIKR